MKTLRSTLLHFTCMIHSLQQLLLMILVISFMKGFILLHRLCFLFVYYITWLLSSTTLVHFVLSLNFFFSNDSFLTKGAAKRGTIIHGEETWQWLEHWLYVKMPLFMQSEWVIKTYLLCLPVSRKKMKRWHTAISHVTKFQMAVKQDPASFFYLIHTMETLRGCSSSIRDGFLQSLQFEVFFNVVADLHSIIGAPLRAKW